MKIIRGKYKKYGTGVYKGAAGTIMAYVEVKGDSRSDHRLYLSSIKKVRVASRTADTQTSTAKPTKTASADTITITKEEYCELVNEVEVLQKKVNKLRARLHKFE